MAKFIAGQAWPYRLRATTLRGALLRLILIALVPLALASVVIVWELWKAQQEVAEDNLRDTAAALALAVDREIAGIQGQLQSLAVSRLADEPQWSELHAFLRTMATGREGAVVGLVDATGQLQLQSNFDFGAPMPNLWQFESKQQEAEWNGQMLPLTSQGLTRAVFATGGPAVSGLYVSMVARRPVVAVAVPVVRGGRVRHALVYSFPTELLDHLLGTEDNRALRLTLIDRDLRVIAKSASAPDAIGTRVAADNDDRLADRKWWVVQRVANDGVAVLSAIAKSDLTGWTVRVSAPIADALAPAYRAAWSWLGLFALVLLAAVVAAVILSGRLASPLVRLARSAGGVVFPPSAPTGIREIDVLSERLAHAAESEEARRAEIERRVAAEERERAAAESEQLVRTHLRELEDADRRKDHFLAMLGHELRNPLSPILNSAQLIRRAQGDADTAAHSAEVIERQVQHLARLIDDLLDVARITEGKIVLKRERVELLPLLYQALESTRGMIEARGQHLTIRTPSAPVFLDADPARIVQVLTNLVNNAAKYTPEGGRIDVDAERDDASVRICVRDDGIGIAPAVMPTLFVAFAQGPQAEDRAQGGLGLGLALVKRLVEMHGGSVTATSDGHGKGSTFVVRLPVVQPGEDAAAANDSPSADGARDTLRCLVVDDNIDAADSMVALLQAAGHRAVGCYDAASALEAWPRERPDLAILDIGLPGMDGFELARRLRTRVDGVEAFLAALTGYGQSSDAERARAAGFDAHLVKPLMPEALERLLHSALDARRSRSVARG